MWQKYCILAMVILGFTLTLPVEAQVTQEWVATYGTGIFTDFSPASIKVDGDQNILVTGKWDTLIGGVDYYDNILTIKYNPEGELLWTAVYSQTDTSEEHPNDMALDGNGNIYVAGRNETGALILKYNANGAEQWVVGVENTHFNALAIGFDGSIYTTGSTGNETIGDGLIVAKYNPAGEFQWVFCNPSSNAQSGSAITIDITGNVYATGYKYSPGSYSDYFTAKLNSSGQEIWTASYDGPGHDHDHAAAICVDAAEHCYVTGTSQGGWPNANDYATIKYDAEGQEEWVARYNNSTIGFLAEAAWDLALDPAGNVVVTGMGVTYTTTYHGDNFLTVKYNAAGVELWHQYYNGGSGGTAAGARALAIDSAANVYVTGGSADSSDGEWHYTTLKYDSAGVQQWVMKYINPNSMFDRACDVALDASANVYVTGYSGFAYPWWSQSATIKYSQPLGVQKPSVRITPTEFDLLSCKPNPFNSYTIIEYQLHAAGFIKIVITDVSGRLTSEIENSWKSAGTHEIVFNGEGLASGIYMCRLTTSNSQFTSKLVLLK